MAGGTFISQNKIRPGAYINIKALAKESNNSVLGIVAIPLILNWGEENKIIEINNIDFMEDKCLKSIGLTSNEEDSQAIREAFKNSYKIISYRLNTGGEKATASIAPLTATAKHTGTLGNTISIIVKADEAIFEVITLVNGKVVDTQKVATIAALKENDFVVFSGEGELIANGGTTLVGGTNGTVEASAYNTYLELIRHKGFGAIGILSDEQEVKTLVINKIKYFRETLGKKVQVVLSNANEANYEGVISVDQGYNTKNEVITLGSFIAYVAGLCAATDINKSNTYHLIKDAISINTVKTDDEIEEGILTGKLMLAYRSDEKIIIKTDINTLHEYPEDRNRDFTKNRVNRAVDHICNFTKNLFETKYIGKVTNSEKGRNQFKAELGTELKRMNDIEAIRDYSIDDIVISQGQEIDSLVVELAVHPLDSMEKLYMTLLVG